ncbi:MAG: bifunctional [glutamine synthetase] adenylyltransferase/[glutamine synthetase]-adenylyl-L-tyrosine phosphorylase [Alphaproteobacteria bacterium]|nr:bifunctional [glutamine synthetase] adenylyltransferase/[glutamine synthetase]-adenylyl-L-tyrosine phosphorylase [Alphaproteobacteria bacterium]
MPEFVVLEGLGALPRPFAPDRVALGLEHWLSPEDPALKTAAASFAQAPKGKALLEAIFGNSPFLSEAVLAEPGLVLDFARRGPDAIWPEIPALAASQPFDADPLEVMRALRLAKRRGALLIALADIAELWRLEKITAALTHLADIALQVAVERLLRDGADQERIALPDRTKPALDSGLAIVAMGKLGAGELNYSSDIDIILFYDPEVPAVALAPNPEEFFVRLARNLVRFLQERTADGYVFRVDLRLRPDPGSTPLAISMAAAEVYYESLGQNWERAAFIKARAAAGDIMSGQGFLDRLQPFIWRKNLDFAAIENIHSIKRQIHRHKGHGKVAVAGHNIKVGRGGIREIEFFAQTQQLIAGGRDRRLRPPTTVGALEALVETGRLDASVAEELTESYRFLRRVEHRLQMIEDEQTQTLPEDEVGLRHLALFAGYPDTAAFDRDMRRHLERVEAHYARLFEQAPTLGAEGQGSLVFTGVEDDPETLETIKRIGFGQPHSVAETIRGWHHGRCRAMRSERARELLTRVTPNLLAALGETADPDGAFGRFDAFLQNLPAGVQLFSLFNANPGILGLVARICGEAPRLSEHLARNASLLDAVLAADFFEPLPDATGFRRLVEMTLDHGRDEGDKLDLLRHLVADARFRIGLHVLTGRADGRVAGAAQACLAEAILAALFALVEKGYAAIHGRVAGGGMAVVGMGKLGGREMTAASDLDLIFVFDHAKDAASDGGRPLAGAHYFARLSQRVIGQLTAAEAEGRLYEVDMRLRPSGNAGPIAVPLEGFITYQADSAWTWEHMALTRARLVAGPPDLVAKVEAAIRDVLTRKRDPDKLQADVVDMRRRIAKQHPEDDPWDIKHAAGGLLDIEFIAQYLQLRWATTTPGVLDPNTPAALGRLAGAGHLAAVDRDLLLEAHQLYSDLMGLLRLAVEGKFHPGTAPQALRATLARVAGQADFAALDAHLREVQVRVREAYGRLVEGSSPRVIADLPKGLGTVESTPTPKRSKSEAMAKAAKTKNKTPRSADMGAKAPDFDLETAEGGRAKLADFAGRKLVLYFYPKDNTPGCTTEAVDFSAHATAFAKAGAAIVGVSRDSAKSHAGFKAKHGLKITLASDLEGVVCAAYGVWVKKQNYGKSYMGIERSTFLIDAKGRIAKAWRRVKVDGHAADVLAAVKGLG